MPNFQAKRWFQRRVAAGHLDASGEAGFLLLEVIISALLVGMIVVATVTGFNVLDRTTAEQRRHSSAAVLAAESQENLRSNSATTLLSFKGGEHVYGRTVGGTSFSIAQKATFGNGSSTTGCNVGEEGSKGKGTYILISSTVTWTGMKGKAVTQSSVITPPIGSALEVKVNNGASTPTAGITVSISYIAIESTGTTTIEGTTNSGGCVLFAGIPATSAKLQVRETAGIVNKQGTLSWPEEEVTLAPNVLTPHEVVLAPGGSLTAAFTYLGKANYEHKQNNPAAGLAEVKEAVTGDTFVALNAEMKLPPNFQTGSNQDVQNFPSGLFEVLPGSIGSYEPTATTQIEPIKYPKGNLFPFPEGKPWVAYAGDCTANDPAVLTKSLATKVTDPQERVREAEARTVSLPTTYVQLNVYKGTAAEVASKGANAWELLETKTSYPVTISNIKCEGVKPDNETAIKNDHVQGTTTGPAWGGHLEAPFQPFGEYEMCLFAGGKTYTPKKYSNLEAAKPVTAKIYLGELSKSEKEAARAKSEGEAKTAREAAELPAWTKIENEEKAEKTTKTNEEATKAARLAKEKAEKEKWEKERSKNEITSGQKTTKENTQKASREAAEATEKKADEKRKAEETATKTARTGQEATKKKAEEKEATTKATAITEETNEFKNKEVTVESGKSSC